MNDIGDLAPYGEFAPTLSFGTSTSHILDLF
jgi:hypothetical protein